MRAAGDKSYDDSLTDRDEAAAYIDAVTGPEAPEQATRPYA